MPLAQALVPVQVLDLTFLNERFAVLINGQNDGIYELSDAVTE
jgi:hypothetical protein